jgi:peptidoglycan/xylan/chitin deacetylase (PgdA/CDA1 family)
MESAIAQDLLMSGVVYLMYHELQHDGRPLRCTLPGYVRYVVRESQFEDHLCELVRAGYRGITVGDALDGGRSVVSVAVTFDDGSETDLLVAAPLLARRGFGATFFVPSGYVGRPGYLSAGQLRELAKAGFEIGCHSRTHAFLTDLGPSALETEIVHAKHDLEQIVGQRIEHFSCPGGRWNRQVSELARAAGYRSVLTSRTGVNYAHSDPYRLARVAIDRSLSSSEFLRICQGKSLRARRAREIILNTAKRLLGNIAYKRLRDVLLKVPS